ncbi:sulfotransferase family 2 domain-containing protein [Aliiroseovarius sp.]|uniref:sulfotransferase family 2 domain-containing protein n=1 Tax=Aliiroseovarius sp. TaxID=1872442 RepID=UPI00261F4459|nr:sulfotransferase family 2 domain-containing protein [Aliiroseovarius sp.]
MIISHKHQFIFMKTTKTAGTSIEIGLSRYCGPQDVLTPIHPAEDEQTRVSRGWGTARNHGGAFLPFTRADVYRLVLARQRPVRFWNHMPATTVRARLGRARWNSYFKFAVSRHPLEVMVSLYRMECSRGQVDVPFAKWLDTNARRVRYNFNMLKVDGALAMDRLVRFSHLTEDLNRVSSYLGLCEPLGDLVLGIRAKPAPEDQQRGPLELYHETDRGAAAVCNEAAEEIAHMGYLGSLEALAR